mgnify:CR=1
LVGGRWAELLREVASAGAKGRWASALALVRAVVTRPALCALDLDATGMVKTRDGALIIVDCWNNRVRRLRNGVVTTFSGGGEE